MVYTLDYDLARGVGHYRDEPKVPYSKFEMSRPYQAIEIVGRITRLLLEALYNADSRRVVKTLEVPEGRLGPSDRPVVQRPSLFLTTAWSITLPARISRCALSSPSRNASE